MAAGVASAGAVKSVVPPPSTFAELLRRSRFASYDPAIAQTYTAPQAYARRGNYGLKRPVPMPYKDSYITVNTFEHHAHFTEWNNAEAPVLFLKRIEELNFPIRPHPKGDWHKSLGDTYENWAIDSEFAETDYGPVVKQPVDAQGQRGPGAYGSRRPPPQTDSPKPAFGATQLNIASLSPQQFRRYLAKLRKLSPQYREHLLEHFRARRTAQPTKEGSEEEENVEENNHDVEDTSHLLYYAAQPANMHNLHRGFITHHFSPSAPSPTMMRPEQIQPQPHPIGGLTYTHFSPLETVLTTRPQPGFILQVLPTFMASFSNKMSQPQNYLALFSGISSLVKRKLESYEPFYNPEAEYAVGSSSDKHPSTIGDPEDSLSIENSIAALRTTSFMLKTPPTKVVGYEAHKTTPQKHLASIDLQTEVAVDVELAKRKPGGNPYRIGSMDYSGHLEFSGANRYSRARGAAGTGMPRLMYAPPGGGAKAMKRNAVDSYFDRGEGNKGVDIWSRYQERNEQRTSWRNKKGKGGEEDLVVEEVERGENAKATVKGIISGNRPF